MNINIPVAAAKIIRTLEQNGFEAYVVGGCVRDSLLGLTPHDWDICTSALPEQTLQCLSQYHVTATGLKHGTVTVIIEHEPFEITTYRVDGIYSDSRHPDSVVFVRSLKEDLARRDFRMNAMAYHPIQGIKDFFGGAEDLTNRLIACVGDADKRLQEDALRILRALRFAAAFDFGIAGDTAQAIHRNRNRLQNIAAERVCAELRRTIVGKGTASLFMDYADVLSVSMPEIKRMVGFDQRNPHHYLDVWAHTVQVIANTPADEVVRFAALFHDIGKPFCYTCDNKGIGHFYGHPKKSAELTSRIMRRLKFDNATRLAVRELVLYHDAEIPVGDKYAKRWLNRIGEVQLRRLLQLKRADTMGQAELYRKERLEKYDAVERCVENVLEQRQCFALKDLAVNGSDLIQAGMPEGAQIGMILKRLMKMVIDEKISNNKEELLRAAMRIYH